MSFSKWSRYQVVTNVLSQFCPQSLTWDTVVLSTTPFKEPPFQGQSSHWSEERGSLRNSLSGCDGLNVHIPQIFYVEILPPNVTALGRGAVGGVQIRRAEPSDMGLVPLGKRPQNALSLFPPCEIQQEDSSLGTRKWALTRHQTWQYLDLIHPILQNYKKSVLFKPASLWL